MLVPYGEVAVFPFSTRNPYTGEAQHADTSPIASGYKDGSLTSFGNLVLQPLANPGQYQVVFSVTGAAFVKDSVYTIRVVATVSDVTDEAPIAQFRIGREMQKDDTFHGLDYEHHLAMAAVGAGAGEVDTGVATGTTRVETFMYPDGTDAFIVTADEYGNRTLVTYP